MNLIYIDESGNTGLNLKDAQQPVFIMAALILESSKWHTLEKDFHDILTKHLGPNAPSNIELHTTDLKARRKDFASLSGPKSLNLRDEMLQLIIDYKIPVIYRRIIKSNFEKFCEKNYGRGIKINPYIMALPFVCMEVDHYLKNKGTDELGMLIFDEQKESLDDTEKTLRTLRLDPGSILKTTNIIEKVFFVDSKKSYAIQLADLACHYIRKYEEHINGIKVSIYDQQTFEKIKLITSTGVGSNVGDILEWVGSHFVR